MTARLCAGLSTGRRGWLSTGRRAGRAAGRAALHVVTAFGTGARIVIGQRAVPRDDDAGGSEITAARAKLATLCLDAVLVTAAIILARGGDYPFALKANHPLMAAQVAGYFADPAQKLMVYPTVDTDHRRIETRRHPVGPAVNWLVSDRRTKARHAFPGLACLACVQSTRQIGDTAMTATSDDLSSARLTPKRFSAAVRAHWATRNALHRGLDMTFDADHARNRKDNGPENLTIPRKRTRNLLRKTRPKLPVSRNRKRAGWSDEVAKTILGQMRQPWHRLPPP